MKNQIKKIMKGNRGITLIALVITIVILIILIAVTVNLTMGENGIITTAKKASDDYKKSAALETLKFKMIQCQIDSSVDKGQLPTLAYLAAYLKNDNEIEYVESSSIKVATIDETPYTEWDKIYTKLSKYPYEFEINNKFQVEINGEAPQNVIPEGYMKIPTANKKITQNGTGIDVTDYATVDVEVSSGTSYNASIYNNFTTWLKLGGISDEDIEQYNDINVLDNSTIMNQVMNNSQAIDYLINSSVLIDVVSKNETSKEILKQYLIKIPNMTSDTTPSGEASASQIAEGYSAYGAFSGFWTDENIQAYGTNSSVYDAPGYVWFSPNKTTTYPSWLQYKFPNDTKIKPIYFEYMSCYSWGLYIDHSIKIQASNDGNTWVDLTDTIQCNGFKKYSIKPTKNIDRYQYFRLNVLSRTETFGSRTDVLIFQVYGY